VHHGLASIIAVLLKLFGKSAVDMLMKIYLRFFRLFSFLQKSKVTAASA